MSRTLRMLAVAGALLLPSWAQAQVLNFDGWCAPPNSCAVGTSYAAQGVTFTPSSTGVYPGLSAGDPGNWDVEGTNGTYFLGFNGPYAMQLNLAKSTTFIALDVTRANGSVDGSFTLTLFNGAVQVFTTTVALGPINSWQRVSASVPGGFNIVTWSGTGTGFHPYAVDNIQLAGNCFGFSDVPTASPFCNATEWLANRGVTLGCTAGTYCPNDNVTRAQMALFMNRLGVALTPSLVEGCCGANDVLDVDTNPVAVCTTSDYTATAFPRHAVVTVSFAGEANAAMGAFADLAYSVDGGTTWVLFDPGNRMRIGATGSGWVTTSQTKGLTLQPWQTIRFGMRFGRETGTGDFSRHRCFVQATIHNRNATTAPFDAATQALD